MIRIVFTSRALQNHRRKIIFRDEPGVNDYAAQNGRQAEQVIIDAHEMLFELLDSDLGRPAPSAWHIVR